MSIELSGYHVPNRIARYMIVTLQDLMGENGLNAVLKQSGLPSFQEICPPDTMDNVFDFSLYSAICAAVANTYGPRGARVFLIRAGKAGFRNGIQSFIDNYGAGLEIGGRILPLSIKLPVFLRWIAKNYSETSDRIVEVKDAGDHYLYINKRCPVCYDRKVTSPDCHITLGFLQEATAFISNGSQFQVRQITSIAAGDESCDFIIPKRPME
ncbi:MAG TPA: 4-vinyl reductase [Anaerolineaceae bacterium]|nr:4-vinyl reductase [Anaerolineaceae bacterium]